MTDKTNDNEIVNRMFKTNDNEKSLIEHFNKLLEEPANKAKNIFDNIDENSPDGNYIKDSIKRLQEHPENEYRKNIVKNIFEELLKDVDFRIDIKDLVIEIATMSIVSEPIDKTTLPGMNK